MSRQKSAGFALILALGLVLSAGAAPAQKVTAEALFQEALVKERAEGKLQEAIFRYERVIAEFPKERKIAAQAMYQLVQIYERLRDPRAGVMLTRLSREYAGVEPYATRAREKLAQQSTGSVAPFPEVTLDKDYEMGSPDGRYVVYDKRPEPRGISLFRLYLKELETGKERLLVDGAGATLSSPVFSPDSQQLAYNVLDTDRNINELRITQIATGETVKTGIDGFPMGWTDTGEIFFWKASGGGTWFLMPAKAGTPRKINVSGVGNATITPDGSRLVAYKGRRLVVIDLASGDESSLTRGAGDEARGMVSRDGRLVAFAANHEGHWALYVARFDEGLPVKNPINLADVSSVGGRSPQWWTRDGLLTFGMYYGDAHIYRVDIDPKSGRAVDAPVQLTQDTEYNSDPSISPDGKRIAYVYSGGTKYGVALMDSSGANERPLTQDRPSGQLDWRSPSELLLQKGDEEGKRWIYSLDIGTGLLQKVVQGAGFYWHYVPARKEVLHYYPNGLVDTSATELKARSLQDATDRVVAKIEHLNPYLVISADGKRIAYSTRRPIQGSNEFLCDLALMKITGEQEGTLIPAQRGGGGIPIGWSPDGKYLLYSHLGPHVMNVETRESWPLHKDASGTGWGEGDWSPDGTFVVLVKRSHRRDRLSWQGVTTEAVARIMNSK